MPNYSNSLSALQNLGTVVQATAHNIANINTHEFSSQRVDLATGPYGQGVHVGRITQNHSAGPAVVNHVFEKHIPNYNVSHSSHLPPDAAGLEQIRNQKNFTDRENIATQEMQTFNESIAHAPSIISQANGTDLSREFANLMVSEFAYSANATVIREQAEVTGFVLDMLT